MMNSFKRRAMDFLVSETGVAATEYAVMLSLVIVALMPAISKFRERVADVFDKVAHALKHLS